MTPNIIPSIFTAIDQLTGPVRRMGVSLQGLGVSGTVAGARLERAFTRVNASAMQMGSSAAMIGAAMLIPLGLATKAAIDFGKGMGDVETLIDSTKESMEEMSDDVLKMGKRIPKTLEDISKALYQIRSDGIAAGHGINQAMGVLETSGKLAVAGLSSTEEAAESVTSAMNVFADEGLTSQQIANSFFKTVQGGKTKMNELNVAFGRNAAIIREAGVSLEEFNAMTATMTMTGMKAATAQVGIGQAVTALIKPSSELTQVYESLGYKGSDAFKRIVTESGGLVAAMEKIDAQGSKMGISFGEDFREKRAMTTELLLTGRLHEQYKKNYAIQMNGEDALDEAFGKQSAKAAQQFQLFRTRVRELGISVGNLLIPALTKLSDKITPIIDGITSFAREHKVLSEIIVTGIGYFGLAAVTVGAVSLAVGTVTKAFWLWKGAIVATNFVIGLSQVSLTTWGAILTGTTRYLGNATIGMNAFGFATKAAFASLLVGYGIYKSVMRELERQENEKNMNPLGFEYEGEANDKGNKKIRDKYSISEEAFNESKKYYNYQREKKLKPNQYYNMTGGISSWPWALRDNKGADSTNAPSVDSTDIKSFNQIQNQQKTDSSFNKLSSAAYVPKSTSNNITVTVENKSDYPVSATSSNSLSAPMVPIKVISTSSRKSPYPGI